MINTLYAVCVFAGLSLIVAGLMFLGDKAQERLEDKLLKKYNKEDNSSYRANLEEARENSQTIIYGWELVITTTIFVVVVYGGPVIGYLLS